MKNINKKLLAVIIALALVIVFFVPFGYGGTQKFTSLTYAVVKWNRYKSDWSSGEMKLDKYKNTCFYLFPDNFKSIDDLWEIRH